MKGVELKLARIRFGDTKQQAAEAIGLKGETSYSRREKGELPFMLPEVVALAKRYSLTDEQIIDIFFRD